MSKSEDQQVYNNDNELGMSHLPHGSAYINKSNRVFNFYKLSRVERLSTLKDSTDLTSEDVSGLLHQEALPADLADAFIENAIGSYSLPLGIATSFKINGKDLFVPMAVEESSVVAAASHGAKLARHAGGFITSATDPVMTGQIQIYLKSTCDWDSVLNGKRSEILDFANKGHDSLLARGGGAKDLDWHFIPEINSLVIHLYIDTRDAMGANIVNTMCEKVSELIKKLLPCELGLRILSNLTARRTAKATCVIQPNVFESENYTGTDVVDRIVKAYLFAFYDPYRAATNNKGIMNGIDPVLIATGNDWRAVEAGCHAWAARSGSYKPLAVWSKQEDGSLLGSLEVPMAVGVVGGVTKLHPTAQAALKILGRPNASELAQIVVATGLAQNLSALRALATEGIQKGHMELHQKNLDLMNKGYQQDAARKGATIL